MKIVIPGGSGQLGTMLANWFHAHHHEVVVLSRNPQASQWRVVEWNGRTVGAWAEELDGAHAVINLAGRSVDCRYDARHRDEIIRSRVESTRAVGEAIKQCDVPPLVWLQMSTATIYAHRFDAPNDEKSGILGGSEKNAPDAWRFSIEVAKAWERVFDDAKTPKTRKVKLRTAMVMTARRGHGAFHALLRHIRMGLGRIGDGRQFVSWIHERDFVRAVEWLIVNESVEGAVNLAAPSPLPMSEFLRDLASAIGRHPLVPVPNWMLRLGAFLLRTEPELVLKSRRVVPARLLERGFAFAFPRWPDAARNLVSQWRGGTAAVW